MAENKAKPTDSKICFDNSTMNTWKNEFMDARYINSATVLVKAQRIMLNMSFSSYNYYDTMKNN